MNDKTFELRFSAATDIGNRQTNQDNFALNGEIPFRSENMTAEAEGTDGSDGIHLFAVCDGVGSLSASDAAALYTLRKFADLLTEIADEKPAEENAPAADEATANEESGSAEIPAFPDDIPVFTEADPDETEAGEETEETSEETGEATEETDEATEETGEATEETGEATEEPGETSEETGETSEETGETSEEPGEATEETGETSEEPGETDEEIPGIPAKNEENADLIKRLAPMSARISEFIRDLNRSIVEMAYASVDNEDDESEAQYVGKKGANTLTALIIRDENYLFLNIGDSPAFLVSADGNITELSIRHNLATLKELFHIPSEPGDSSCLLYYLGNKDKRNNADSMMNIRIGKLTDGDRFLLCSDGVTNVIPTEKIADFLKDDRTAKDFVTPSAAVPGADNCTAVVISVKKTDPAEQSQNNMNEKGATES